MAERVTVCIFGVSNINLKSEPEVPFFETDDLDCYCFLTDEKLDEILVSHRPNVILTFGNGDSYQNLWKAPYEVRKRWIHHNDMSNLEWSGRASFNCFLYGALKKVEEAPKKVTVFTPTYRTGENIMRAFNSMKRQTYGNWEWILYDDSPKEDNNKTFEKCQELAKKDFRIKAFKPHQHSGIIGEVKRNACMLATGDLLLELDHDDELLPRALEYLVRASDQHPECGFFYSDFAEVYPNGSPLTYGNGWGFGYGTYRDENVNGRDYKVCNAPPISCITMRHIVAFPNHYRAWRRDTYLEIGGHNPEIHVGDDYELGIRTFLNTKMCRVPIFSYIQWRNDDSSGGNAHQTRNMDIQRLVRKFSEYYDDQIHERFVELGIDDFVYKKGEHTFSKLNKIQRPSNERYANIVAEFNDE
jgi:glycosyltransferase involved in cell wall biosynthesis